MSKISNLMAKETVIDVEFPDIEGFVVNLVYLGRDDLMKIRNASLTYKFNKRTRQREEEIDNDKFIEEYARRAIKGWSGLKVGSLPKLLPVDISAMDKDEAVDYSEEDALDLLQNSTIFDQFVTDAMNDYEQFSISKKAEDAKNSKSTSGTTSKQGE
jgi:preprotein translocase subunit SecA